MSRSREFGPTIFQRLEQGSQAREAMLNRATAPYAARVNTYVPLEKPNHTLSRLLLAGSAVGLAVSLNFIADGLSITEAWGTPTATSTSTVTSTPTPTRTPTSVRSRATVGVSGDGGVKIEIDNSNSNSNDLTQRLIDALLNPLSAGRAIPADTPKPTDTPTPTDADKNLAAAKTAVAEGKKEKTAGDLLGQATALAQPTPNGTETREAKRTAAAKEIADIQAIATAAVPRDIARAQKTAVALGIQEEAAEIEADNKRTEERIRSLRGLPSLPAPNSGAGPSTNGGFPWMPVIILTGGLAAIYALRVRVPYVGVYLAHIPGPRI